MAKSKPATELTALELALISSYKPDMIAYLNAHPDAFDEALTLALTDKQPFSWRAAYGLYNSLQENDLRVRKRVKKIIAYLPHSGKSQQRELMKILLLMKIPDSHEGTLYDIAVDFWKDINKDPSVRFTAFRMILKIAAKYPELNQEITLLLHDHYFSTLSPGVRHSVMKMRKKNDGW
jgi:hypothetical protein